MTGTDLPKEALHRRGVQGPEVNTVEGRLLPEGGLGMQLREQPRVLEQCHVNATQVLQCKAERATRVRSVATAQDSGTCRQSRTSAARSYNVGRENAARRAAWGRAQEESQLPCLAAYATSSQQYAAISATFASAQTSSLCMRFWACALHPIVFMLTHHYAAPGNSESIAGVHQGVLAGPACVVCNQA